MSELAKYFSDTRKAAPRRKTKEVFVFGSNEAGVHGAGAARAAHLHYGAVYGKGVGHYGDSYALPTKNKNIKTLPYDVIEGYVNEFIKYANENTQMNFKVTQVGCGLAGLNKKIIALMFVKAPLNCSFDTAWKEYLPSNFSFWGTH